MKRTIVEQLANKYARFRYKVKPEIDQAVEDYIEGFKAASLFLDEIVNDFDINDFFNGKKSIEQV